MPIKPEDLDDLFRYHPPEADQPARYERLRSAAKDFAAAILSNTPPSADQTYAIRQVRSAVMFANAAIALKGKF